MREGGWTQSRPFKVAVVIAAVIVLAVAGYVLAHRDPVKASGGEYAGYSPEPTPTVTVAPMEHIEAPKGTSVVFLGDSWTEGYGATPETRGWMYLAARALGWRAQILGSGGSGYISTSNGTQPFDKRIAAAPRAAGLVLQGSINDLRWVPTYDFPGVVDRTLARAKSRFRWVIVVGPCATQYTSYDARLQLQDEVLAYRAHLAGLRYVSCSGWLDAKLAAKYLDPAKLLHPTNAGYAYLASKLIPALRAATGR